MVKKNPVLKTKILKMSPPPHTVPLTTRACYTQLNTHHNQDYILLLAYCIFLDPLMLSLTASSIQILTHCCQRHVQTHGCPVAPPVHKKLSYGKFYLVFTRFFSWPATYDYYFLAAFDSLLIILLLLVMDSSSSPCYYYFRLATSGILGRFAKTWQLKE